MILPRNTDLHYALGTLYEKTGRYDEGIQQMKAVLKIDPDHADALNFIGYSYADRGVNLGEAEKLILKAMKLKPGNGYITDSRGWVYYRQNRYDLALKHLQEAAAILPEDGAIAEHLGDVYLKTGQRDKALAAYQRALKLNPDSAILPRKIAELLKQ